MKREAGFTVVELVTVVAIVGIMTGIVALNLAGTIKASRLKEATTQFYGDVKKWRVDAMTNAPTASTRGVGFVFNNSTSYSHFRFDDADNDFTVDNGERRNPADSTTTLQIATVPNGVQVNSGALTTPFLFDRRGWLRSADWSAASGATYLFTLAGVTQARCVVLTSSRIRQGVWCSADSPPDCKSKCDE